MKTTILKIHGGVPVDLLTRICKAVDEYAGELGLYDRFSDVVLIDDGDGHLEFVGVPFEKKEAAE